MAKRKGLEPSPSGVTGRRYNQLNYRSNSVRRCIYSKGNGPWQVFFAQKNIISYFLQYQAKIIQKKSD